MSVYLFTALFNLLLFLLMCGTLCGQLFATAGDGPSPAAENLVEVFEKDKQLDTVLKTDGTAKQENVESVTVETFYSPVVLSSGNVIVALAAIKGSNKIDNNITVLTKYIGIEGSTDWAEKLFTTSGGGGWTTQFAAYKECSSNNCVYTSVVRGLVAAAASDNKIYLLLVNASTTGSGLAVGAPASVSPIEFRLAKGTTSGGKITWDTEKQLTPLEADQQFTQLIKGKQLSKIAFPGFALLKEEKVIFLLRIVTNDDKKTVLAFIELKGTGGSEKVHFLPFDEVAQNCHPYFFIWESKIILIPTQCKGDSSNQKIKEITDITATENKWTVSSGPFNIFVGFFQDKSDFTTANINDNEVLLFTQKKTNPPANHDVYLWVTDGNHSYRAKEALTVVSDAPISLLYKDNELLALYQKWEQTGPKSIVLRQLKTQLSDITTVIEAWKEIPQIVKKLCNGKTSCDTPPPTDGLVGFLQNIANEDTGKFIWKDAYYFSSVTVVREKAERATNGLKLSGAGKRAEWSMQNQQEKVYNFITSGFTLVATVEIGSDTNGKKNSILGVTLTSNTNTNNNVGLWCNTDGKWGVSDRDNSALELSEKECKQGNTYNVALVLGKENGRLDIYVNGEKLTAEIKTIEPPESIEKFYFGANVNSDESYVTVTNVLLYNRPFDTKEIQNLKQYTKSVEVVTPPDEAVDSNTTGGSSDEPTPPPIPTSTKEKEDKTSLPSRTEDGGVGGGVRVFSLLLAVLCAALLLHL